MSKRVLVIGLDGFEKSIADRLINAGRMPHLKKLISGSAKMDLEHGEARRTGLAWEHFSTGLTPEGARRWSAITFDPGNYSCQQQPTKLTPFPAKFDFKTVVFDTPYFDLAKAPQVDGIVSWGAHDPGTPQCSHPESLTGEVLERFGKYPAKPWIYGFTWPSVERTRAMGKSLSEAVLLRTRISRWLLKERFQDWSLGIVVVSELHSAIEALWHGVDETHPLHNIPSSESARDGLESVYEAVDELLGTMTESFPDCLHVVFSMHGMGPNAADVPAMALLPEFLYRRHFGQAHILEGLQDVVEQMCSDELQSWTTYVRSNWIKKSFLVRALRRMRTFVKNGPRKSRGNSLSWMPAYWYVPYWPQMPAFALPAFYDGQIRINVQGRESKGVVPVNEYDSVCKAIVADLNASIDPKNGCSVVKEVVFTHPGDPLAASETEADIIIIWEGSPMAFHTKTYGDIGPLPPRRPGGHTGGAGVALWAGPNIVPGEYGVYSAFDMVPSLIDYLTNSSASDVDGQSFINKIQR